MRSSLLRGFVPGPLGRPACFACRAQWRQQLARSSSPSPSSFSTSPAYRQRAKSTQLPDTPARTRFAPSPTGYLHLGSLRTALYNYLLARATNGQFLLRIEDTDQSRLVADAEQRLYDDLRWAGLHWDEGPDCGGPYGPYRQSERLPLYREHADRLLAEGKAFRCFCSHDDLEAHQREALQGQAEGSSHTTYPGRCLAIPAAEAEQRAAAGETHTIRFRGDLLKDVTANDLVYGRGRRTAVNQPDDHFILIKSDGFPTYHFANVVDDHRMRITHVVRGAEWLVSTPKHARLYAALGWTPPVFAHVGLLVDQDRQKLSKRNMDTSFAAYQALNVQPAALLNFAALLGWHPQKGGGGGGGGRAKEVLGLDEMVERFTLKFTKGDIVVDTEKLAYFRRQHLRRAIDGPACAGDFVDAHVVGPMLAAVRAQEEEAEARTAECVLRLAEEDEAATRGRLRDLLRISRSTAVDPEDLVHDNAHVVWDPAPERLARAWDALAVVLDGQFIVTGLDTNENTDDASLSDVVDLLSRHFASAQPQQWTETGIKAVLDTLAGAVSLRRENASKDDPKPLPSGATIVYKLLRWALLASEDGPQMVPLMLFLGQERTVERLSRARKCNVDHGSGEPTQKDTKEKK